MKQLLTGNEAIALAAIDAGASYAAAYPGTPSTEILETLSGYPKDIYAEWAPNEKVALEGAIGASYAGARALASMKHVGLNVAADPFFTNAYTGINAGLVVITADEPGMHSSQNEQDNRYYAYHAYVPMLEPSNSQDCYDMVLTAYEISETYDIPVLVRTTTRVAHAKSVVTRREAAKKTVKPPIADPMKYVTVPAVSQKLRVASLEKMKKMTVYANSCNFNVPEYHDTALGVVASGIAYEYAKEVFGETASYFKVGFSFPLPIDRIREFSERVDKLIVLEENEPIMETQLKAAGIKAIGKEIFPTIGELLPDVIRASYFSSSLPRVKAADEDVPARPPTLCAGCPHRGLFTVLGKEKNVLIFGDIGCYTLAFSAPYNGMHAVTCMGASISSAHGASKIFDRYPAQNKRAVAVIGDSTFFHTGINSLINVAYNKGNVITIILDNRITGMTGHQQNPGTGYTAQMEETDAIDIPTLVKAIGIDSVKTVNPNRLDEVEEAITWARSIQGPSVIVTRWPCALKRFSKEDVSEFGGDLFTDRYEVDETTCIGCKTCLKAGCPAISVDNAKGLANISSACVGCSVCSQLCPTESIRKVEASK